MRKGKVMGTKALFILLGLLMVFMSTASLAQDSGEGGIKGLDQQVQEIKSDVLSIAAELKQLEEQLLFPSNSQVAVFVSMDDEDLFRLDAIDIVLDGQPVASHLYSFKELDALQKGGVQRIYTGNIKTGQHVLNVVVRGEGTGGGQIFREESFQVDKAVGPAFYQLVLTGHGISLNDR